MFGDVQSENEDDFVMPSFVAEENPQNYSQDPVELGSPDQVEVDDDKLDVIDTPLDLEPLPIPSFDLPPIETLQDTEMQQEPDAAIQENNDAFDSP